MNYPNQYGYSPYGAYPNVQQSTSAHNQIFPQPNGNVYLAGSSKEFKHLPVGSGITVGLCITDGLLCCKTAQNGDVVTTAYKLSPIEDANAKTVESYLKRIEHLENEVRQLKGGQLNEYTNI